MKSNRKIKINLLMSFGIVFVLSMMINSNLNFNRGKSDDSNLDNKNLQISANSGKISITDVFDHGWTDAKAAGIVTGGGTYLNPYVIKDLVIDAGGSGSGIKISQSDVFFKIKNCTVYNSGTGGFDAGIRLFSVSNGQLINNDFSNNFAGIYLASSSNNIISGNTVNENSWRGINLNDCTNNVISGNIANDNNQYGIILSYSDTNTVSGNTVNNNNYGILLSYGDMNTVSGNTANNNNFDGISLFESINSIILGNHINGGGLKIYGNLEELTSYNIDITNLVNGKPLYYYANEANLRSSDFLNAGQVILVNCSDSLILNLNTSYSSNGISLYYCNNITISGNNANNNNRYGIYLDHSDINTVSGNTANNNRYGITLSNSNNTNIEGNTVNNNTSGIGIILSNNNIISGNILIGNDECIIQENSKGNQFSDNGSCTYGQGGGTIPGYYLFFLLGILSIVVIILSKKLKKF